MKRIVVLVLLSSCATACFERQDTESAEKWPRFVEARVEGAVYRPCRKMPTAAGRVVDDVQCGDTKPAQNVKCDVLTSPIESPAQAAYALEWRPECTARAAAALEGFARRDASLLSDLSAAYSVRAQREDRATDLLRALDTAENAVRMRPQSASARFNFALAQEAVGLEREALASWNQYLKLDPSSEWAGEARTHQVQLQQKLAYAASAHWKRNLARIEDALRRRDAAAVARLIAPFPKNALHYFELQLIPRGERESIQLFASQLSARLQGDRYPLDLASGDAGALHLAAELRHALALALERRFRDALVVLTAIEHEADVRGYRYLQASIHSMRGYVYHRENSYVQALGEYARAQPVYEALGDDENLASLYRSTTSIYRDVGQYDLSFREALRARRYVSGAIDVRIRHVVHGEMALTALALGYPRTALLYQESAIALLREQGGVPDQLARAYRERARIELAIPDYEAAKESLRLYAELADEIVEEQHNRNVLGALVGELEGRTLLKVDPGRAAGTFVRALGLLGPDELPTLRASLLAQRADALRLAGRDAEAERALWQSFEEIRKEERQVLQSRKRGEAESIWSSYFARFRDAHDHLARQLIEQGRVEEAFAFAERTRAIEPLNLVLQLDFVPGEFRALTQGGEPIALREIQRRLPPGTFLLQYYVTEARTYTWIVARDQMKWIDQEVPRRLIDGWRAALQDAGRRHDSQDFGARLYAPYEKLLALPLDAISKMPGGRQPRLVIIPDGPMHGLPFPALRDGVTGRHLIEIAPVESEGSATLYIFSLLRSAALSKQPPSALLIGNPAFDRTMTFARELDDLPAAAAEAERIRGYYGPRAEVRVGAEATVPEFKRLARDKTVVHFAGHSIVNPEDPPRSLLLFAPSNGNSGAIEARELLTDLSLEKTRLVVLSSCSSAGGLPVGPEGVAPLVRPFLVAGVPAVIGSLWEVEDATAAELFVSFHHDYRRHGDAAAALRSAQIEFLKRSDRRQTSLTVWASFQVIGH